MKETRGPIAGRRLKEGKKQIKDVAAKATSFPLKGRFSERRRGGFVRGAPQRKTPRTFQRPGRFASQTAHTGPPCMEACSCIRSKKRGLSKHLTRIAQAALYVCACTFNSTSEHRSRDDNGCRDYDLSNQILIFFHLYFSQFQSGPVCSAFCYHIAE